jgi:hypothetical protein
MLNTENLGYENHRGTDTPGAFGRCVGAGTA